MVNLTIHLNKLGANSRSKLEHNLLEADEAALPQHFGNTKLPIVKGIGFLFPEACKTKFLGAKSQYKLGSKVRICLMCNFPIAIYGRMDPCHHILCFACAKSDSTCFVCKEKVARVEKVDVLVGIFICGVPGCLRSFLIKHDFELHVANNHSQNQQLESTKEDKLQCQVERQDSNQLQVDSIYLMKNSSANFQTIVLKKEEAQRNRDERIHERRNYQEFAKQGQKTKRSNNDQTHEGQNQRNRIYDTGSWQSLRKRERERGGHPPASFNSSSKHVQNTYIQQTRTLPPPSAYPPPNYSSTFSPLNETIVYPPQLEHQRDYFHPRLAMPPRLEQLDTNVTLQHPGPVIGLQLCEWPLNFIPHEGLGTNNACPCPPVDNFGHSILSSSRPITPGMTLQDGFPQMDAPRPLFFPVGMPLGRMPRFHEGHLRPRPPGPLSKHTTFNGPCPPSEPSLGEMVVDYGWGRGNLTTFGTGSC